MIMNDENSIRRKHSLEIPLLAPQRAQAALHACLASQHPATTTLICHSYRGRASELTTTDG